MAKKVTREAYGSPISLGGLRKLDWRDVVEIYKLAR
jgi:hypothetical protein